MQKEALVSNSVDSRTWRLACDEGPWLDATDIAPNPLAILGTGMVCSYMSGIEAVASRRDIEVRDLKLVLDNRYTSRGSALKETMTGSALPPELEVMIDSPAVDTEVEELVQDAVDRSPVTGLLRDSLPSRFNLFLNDRPITPERVGTLDGDAEPNPADRFENLPPVAGLEDTELIRHTGQETPQWEGETDGYTDSGFSTMRDQHDRMLHLRFTATPRPEGGWLVVHDMYSPRGSIFELVSDEPGRDALAPDPMSYVAAGIGFCFMTQLGRQSALRNVDLDAYHIVQDTHFSGGRRGWADGEGRADPVETHLYLETNGDEDFARTLLYMAEQTCYAHAACRQGDLEPTVDVTMA